jgi:hypothetical protein
MSTEKLKPYQLFEDLAEKQRIVKANAKKTTLEEARAIIKWLKDGKADKKERPDIEKLEEQIKKS